jgi:hypothetical protein
VETGSLCSGQCLTSTGLLELLGVTNLGAQRAVDLSEAGAASVEYRLRFPDPPLTTGTVRVEASLDGGAWSLLATHSVGTNGTFTSDLPVGGEVRIRFSTSGLALGASWGVDDVTVEITMTPSTTSTTSTTTTSTIPGIITAPTITLPPVTVPTITVPSVTVPHEGTTTTVHDVSPTTVRTRPRDLSTTTTTSEETAGSSLPTTTTTTARDSRGSGGDEGPSSVQGGPQPTAEESPVIRGIDPGLAPRSTEGRTRDVQTNLLARFLISSEDIAFDLLTNASLGVVLVWVSLRRFGPKDR